jgi:hypothetical protein
MEYWIIRDHISHWSLLRLDDQSTLLDLFFVQCFQSILVIYFQVYKQCYLVFEILLRLFVRMPYMHTDLKLIPQGTRALCIRI